ncbi:DUF924 family protein [Thalassotalea sp. ND16A]|uniref:DUF924 family protein n=1 Tax=Thalassotalea sp. ND16A TaxID=1535422 RepID=UPI00051A73A2|nr:DUF924 family protein [Thalassotalea sp. ND16A]KGJ87506.1 hypothetical protein ND16A_2889 [Thalassotalea sp. ND16A]
MDKNINVIIDFWFGKIEQELSAAKKNQLWYLSTAQDDATITRQFEHLYERALQGQLNCWSETAKGTMALIIVLDQLPRNMYRGTDKAFKSDHLALQYCLLGLAKGYDKQLSLVERSFFYHPLEHAEDINMQQRCVVEFQRLQQEYQGEKQRQFIRSSLEFAKLHLDIIEQFGRFPYRNQVLGRVSTAEEIEFIEKGVNFGQTRN